MRIGKELNWSVQGMDENNCLYNVLLFVARHSTDPPPYSYLFFNNIFFHRLFIYLIVKRSACASRFKVVILEEVQILFGYVTHTQTHIHLSNHTHNTIYILYQEHTHTHMYTNKQ